jgi:REP element-mobilizing transposase RayT
VCRRDQELTTGATVDRVPRKLRPQVPGGIYHVISKGIRDESIYVDAESRRHHLALCTVTVDAYGWLCPAYCQMGNHYHLLVRTPEPNISDGMQYLNARYAEWFNWRHGYSGHLFKGRFWSELVETDEYLVEVARYIVLNPLRAGLRGHPGDWPWSSYRATVGAASALRFLTTDWLLEQFGRDPKAARAAYAAFVSEGARTLRGATSRV